MGRDVERGLGGAGGRGSRAPTETPPGGLWPGSYCQQSCFCFLINGTGEQARSVTGKGSRDGMELREGCRGGEEKGGSALCTQGHSGACQAVRPCNRAKATSPPRASVFSSVKWAGGGSASCCVMRVE